MNRGGAGNVRHCIVRQTAQIEIYSSFHFFHLAHQKMMDALKLTKEEKGRSFFSCSIYPRRLAIFFQAY